MLVLLEDGEVTIIMAGAKEDVFALAKPNHKAERLAYLVVRLLLAVADIDEAEERLGARKGAPKGLEVRDGPDDTARL